jgi:hypothetical protein
MLQKMIKKTFLLLQRRENLRLSHFVTQNSKAFCYFDTNSAYWHVKSFEKYLN